MLFRKKSEQKPKHKPKTKRPLFRKIINIFLGMGIGFLIIFLVAFGYTQTSSFRNWLKDFAVEQVNSSSNGKLAIEQLNGTIFTTLILSNTSYVFEKDTLLTAEKIEIKISPLRIFLKTIYIRKLDIENAYIALSKDEKGVLNFSKITNPPEEEVMEEAVTTSKPFSWKIDISGLNLKNINFRHQSFDKKNSTAYYPQLFMDDLRLKNLNLSLTANINIAANEYQLYISKFNVEPNLEGFKLLDLSGNFILLKDVAGIVDLNIVTDRSTISLNAASSDFKPFEDDFDIAGAPLKVELDVENINFDDLTNFIDGTDILEGNVKTKLDAEGSLNNLNVENLEVELSATKLTASGTLQNITDGGEMNINMNFKDSYINQDDVTNLLPSLEIPTYKDYGVLNFDTLSYSGQPLNFAANMYLRTDMGKVNGVVKMDLRGEEIVYDYQIITSKLDLTPVAGINTNLNLFGSLKGKGFSPETLENDIKITAGESTIQGVLFSNFDVDAGGSNGIISTDISFTSLETQGIVKTKFDFTDSATTKYNFDVLMNGFNISDFAQDSDIDSDLNFSFKGDGENFGEDDLNLFAILEINKSRLNEIELDSTVLITDVRSTQEKRIINIISDLADLTITGKYSIPELVDLISAEVNLLSTSVQNKIAKIQPPKIDNRIPEEDITETKKENLSEIFTNKNLDVQYLLELKSFELISLFLGNAEIEIDGEISGELYSSADTTYLNLKTDIDQMRFWDGLDLYFVYDFNFDLAMMNGPSLSSFDDFYADIKIDAARTFIGSELTNLKFNLIFNHNEAEIVLGVIYDGTTALDLEGMFAINDEVVDVNFNKLRLKYQQFVLQNYSDIIFSYSNDEFLFDSFTLNNEDGKLDINGRLSFTGEENLSLTLNDINLKNISTDILQLPPEKMIEGDLNLQFSLKGTSSDPQMEMEFTVDSIRVQKYNLGSFASSAKYSDRLLNANLSFLERKNNQERKSLRLEGTLPIDLSFNAKDILYQDREIDLALIADNFDLRFASSFIPGLRNLNGTLNGTVNLNGYYEDVIDKGELTIDNTSFVLDVNNLTYWLDAKINFENGKILLSNMSLKNDASVKNGGTMRIAGEINHKFFNFENVDISASGSLKVLDDKTKAVNPSLYGNITVQTNEDIVFQSSEQRSYLGLDLILKSGASITYSPTQTAFTNESDKFTYIFASPEIEDELEKEIDSLLVLSELKRQEKNLAQRIPFNFDLKLRVEKELKFVFVLSREFKQNLTAYLGGELEYSVINEIPFASGEFTLLDGSKLDFIKTFQAEGNIRFIEELNNPYINVVATYESYYNPDTLRTTTSEYDVQIRIKLEGNAQDIVSRFSRAKDNISVYKSRRNANQFELDQTKSGSDAIFFIIVNKFPEDATLQESGLVASTINAFAGSVIGAILNEQFGDAIRTVNIQQRGSETVFSLVGKVEEFRYEIGGTSQVFQDLSRATVKIEHPLFVPNFVIRFYRTEPPYQSSTYSEMINELGLKYTFVF